MYLVASILTQVSISFQDFLRGDIAGRIEQRGVTKNRLKIFRDLAAR